MVGAAGKSKACATCRRRRVKCDLRRPSCLTCIKSGRTCEGYDRSIVFADRKAKSSARAKAKAAVDAQEEQVNLDKATALTGTEADLRLLFLESQKAPHKFRAYALDLLRDIYLPTRPYLDRLEVEGWLGWAFETDQLERHSPALDAALYSFCLAMIFCCNVGNATLEHCLLWHDEGLQRLRVTLDDPNSICIEETLAAIIYLATQDLFIKPVEDAWHIHARGVAAVVKSRRDAGGPVSYTWRMLICRVRILCTLESMIERHAPLVDAATWRQLMGHIEDVNPVEVFFDTWIDIGALYELTDSVYKETDPQELLKSAGYVARCLFGFISRIESCFDSFRNASSTPIFWTVPSASKSPADLDSSNKVFPFCIEFVSVGRAIALSMCWACQTQMYSDIILLYDLVGERVSPEISLQQILDADQSSHAEVACKTPAIKQAHGEASTISNASIEDTRLEGAKKARLVCQSMEFQHRKETGIFGIQTTSYQRWVARHYYKFHAGHPREAAWCEHLRSNTGKDMRWELDGHKLGRFADMERKVKPHPKGIP